MLVTCRERFREAAPRRTDAWKDPSRLEGKQTRPQHETRGGPDGGLMSEEWKGSRRDRPVPLRWTLKLGMFQLFPSAAAGVSTV